MLCEDIIPGSLQPPITSNDDIYLCYKKHINLMLEINRKYYSFMGTTSFGNKFEDTLSWQRFQKDLYNAIKQELAHHHEIQETKFNLGEGVITLVTKNKFDRNINEVNVPILLLDQ